LNATNALITDSIRSADETSSPVVPKLVIYALVALNAWGTRSAWDLPQRAGILES
jgi:hypothetical protein